MSKKQALPDSLNHLQIEKLNLDTLVLLSTIDHESGSPSIAAISWVKAVSGNEIRLAITNTSRIYKNISENPRVTLCFIGLGTVYSIPGTAHIIESKMEEVAMPLAKIKIDIHAVFESMFWGAKITQEPVYEKTYDLGKAEALDKQVCTALLR
ncbi:pyridoxamine 5'-phosphate oxidase family protein [Paenibacillus periandrae]|uniref:pyridoxamine 5'-phosphate oxidase family protein n=1 Tax=Paenibacillus periandrae TaxID=1761741 RepID=UPI001F08C4D9|nr:pyridoxamine 5'-phosphate oxidase family protein [Paenibacillus periandrae]